MTSKIFFICTLAAFLTAEPLTASTPNVDITVVKVAAVNKTLQVKIVKTLDEPFDISIEAADGTVVYNEQAAKTAVWKRYDLRQLETGNYLLIVKNGRTKTIQPFALNFNGILITETERMTKQLPQITQVGTGINVRVYTPKKALVKVQITDNQGISVFKEETETLALAKHYNLNKLPSGVYFVEVEADGETQYSTISIK
jgi:Secretion system C-terminal sorting domain